MKVIRELLSSEKFVVTVLAIVAATVGAFQGALTWGEYYSFVQVATGVYIGGKALQGAAASITNNGIVKDIERLEEMEESINAAIEKRLVEKFPPETESLQESMNKINARVNATLKAKEKREGSNDGA